MGTYFNEKEKSDRNEFKRMIKLKLSPEEKRIFEKLETRVKPEDIIIYLGRRFGNKSRAELSENEVENICIEMRKNSVLFERNMKIAREIFVGIKKMDANPKMLLKIFFENEKTKMIEKPNWELMRTMYSILGVKLVNLTKNEANWIESLVTREKIASEWEVVESLFYALDTEEGHKLIDHLYNCKSTICRCGEKKKMLNDIIKKIDHIKKEINNQYIIYSILSREDRKNVTEFLNKIIDVYWFTNFLYTINTKKPIEITYEIKNENENYMENYMNNDEEIIETMDEEESDGNENHSSDIK
jgi:hypothetical protein